MASSHLLVTAFRDALVDLIEEVPYAGVVYPKIKFSSDWTKFLDNFSYTKEGKKHIRGWWISLPTVPYTSTRYDQFNVKGLTIEYPIRGIMSYSDTGDSENEFALIIYQVYENISSSTNGGVVATVGGDSIIAGTIEVSMPIVELRQYGSILNHFCEMRVRVTIEAPVT